MPLPPKIRSGLALLAGLAGALVILHAWQLPPFSSSVQTTDNAYVRGQVTTISPQLAGYVTGVTVQDFAIVHTGDVLFEIDDRIFRQKLAQAEANRAIQVAKLENADQSEKAAEARITSSRAQLAGAEAALATARTNAGRIESLLTRGVAAQSAADQSRLAVAQAEATRNQAAAALDVAEQDRQTIIVNRDSLKAAIDEADAAVRLAEIDVQNTRIRAPQDGRLGEIGVRLGQYVSAGSQLASLVPDRRWVIANFKETQIAAMRVGQPVSFSVDALGDATLTGTIDSFSPAAGSEFSVLKTDNASGNFTKIAQRLPVRIAIDPDQPLAADLAPGMSVVVHIDTASHPSRSAEAPTSAPAAPPRS